jgi:teichuronic acid biosynthesis glycosyltransferase TuaH
MIPDVARAPRKLVVRTRVDRTMDRNVRDIRDHRSRPPRHDRGLIVLCAANNYDSVKMMDQHFAERWAQRGPVLYVDPPISHLTPRNQPAAAASLRGPRLRRMEGGFWRLTPVVAPFPMRRGMRSVTERAVRHMVGRAVHSIGGGVDAVVNAWPELDAFGACRERLRVFWAQDDFAAGAELMGLDARRVAEGEAARADGADLVVAANPLVAQRWRDAGCDVELIPYGADVPAFASPPDAASVRLPEGIRRPVAVVVGQLNERTDPAMLEAVADLDLSLVLIGPVPRLANAAWLDELLRRENVHWMGPQPFEALPGLVTAADVGLVPYADTPFNRACFPLKTVEYLAAGLPVVATDLPAIRWLDAPAEHLRIARTPPEFAGAVAEAARSRSASPGLVEARREFARAHGYDGRARAFLDAVDRRVAAATESTDPAGVGRLTASVPERNAS